MCGSTIKGDKLMKPSVVLPGEAEDDRPTICCPKCGNTDWTRFEFQEEVTSVRSIAGFNEYGGLVIIYTGEIAADSDHNGRFVCQGSGDGPRHCFNEVEVPQGLDIDWQ